MHSFVAVVLFACAVLMAAPATPAHSLPDEPSPSSVTPASSSQILQSYSYSSGMPLASTVGRTVEQPGSKRSMMELSELSPTLVEQDDELRASLRVTNTTSQPISSATVHFNMTRVRFMTRSGLDVWDAQELEDAGGTRLMSETLDEVLEPGSTASFQFKVDARQFGLLTGLEGWGPRGITFELVGDVEGQTQRIDAFYTYVLWYPAADAVEQNLSVATVAAITGVTSDPLDPDANVGQVLAQTGSDERLPRVLKAVENSEHVGLAVDAATIQSIQDAATVTTEDESTSEEAAAETVESTQASFEQGVASRWVDGFLEVAPKHELLSLPTFDASFAPYLATAADVPTPRTSAYGALGDLSFTSPIAWPVASDFSTSVLNRAASSGYPITVAQSQVLTDSEAVSYTRSGTFKTEEDSETTVFDADERITELLLNPGTENPIQARQRLIAELAVLSKERPNEHRNVVIALDRSWSPDPAVAQAQLTAISGLPWIRTAGLSELAGQEQPVDAERVTVASPQSPALFAQGEFAQLRDNQRALVRFATVTEDPSLITEPHWRAVSRLTSQAWYSNTSEHATAVAAFNESVSGVMNSINIVPSSDINMISTGAEIPLTVQNNLDQDVSFAVQLSPSDSRLQAPTTLPVQITASSTQSIRIPVTAVGSGNVEVKVQILDESGKYVATSGVFRVRVRADWENVGTGVVLGLLALLLAGGIWRTVRRGHSERRVSALDSKEALALVEAEAEERK